MKKILFTLVLTMAATLVVSAQTNFRKITYAEALQAARAESKLVFIDFYTTWCGPCMKMSKEVFPQQQFGAFMNEKFVCIQLDAEKEGKDQADQFKINAYPTFVVVDPDGKEQGRTLGFHQADDMQGQLTRMLDPTLSVETLRQKFEQGPRTPELVKTYAGAILEGAQTEADYRVAGAKARQVVMTYFNGLTDEQRVAPENMFIYRLYTITALDSTANYLMENRQRFAQPERHEVDSILGVLNRNLIYAYFNGGMPIEDKSVIATLKDRVKTLELDPKGELKMVFDFIDAYTQKDINGYLNFCQRNFSKLTQDQQDLFISTFVRLLGENPSQQTKQQASAFMRSQLATMSPRTISYSAMQLEYLERK